MGFFVLPYLNNPHYSGPIQWARGDVRRINKALRRRAPLGSGVMRMACGGSGAKALPLAARPNRVHPFELGQLVGNMFQT